MEAHKNICIFNSMCPNKCSSEVRNLKVTEQPLVYTTYETYSKSETETLTEVVRMFDFIETLPFLPRDNTLSPFPMKMHRKFGLAPFIFDYNKLIIDFYSTLFQSGIMFQMVFISTGKVNETLPFPSYRFSNCS